METSQRAHPALATSIESAIRDKFGIEILGEPVFVQFLNEKIMVGFFPDNTGCMVPVLTINGIPHFLCGSKPDSDDLAIYSVYAALRMPEWCQVLPADMDVAAVLALGLYLCQPFGGAK